jgi:hypothetical protein
MPPILPILARRRRDTHNGPLQGAIIRCTPREIGDLQAGRRFWHPHRARFSRCGTTRTPPSAWLTRCGKIAVEGAEEQIDRLSKKYLGRDIYPLRSPDEQRLTVRIAVDYIDGYGF